MENKDTGGAGFGCCGVKYLGQGKQEFQSVLCKKYFPVLGGNLWKGDGVVSLFGGGMDALSCGMPFDRAGPGWDVGLCFQEKTF